MFQTTNQMVIVHSYVGFPNYFTLGKSQFLLGKLTISTAPCSIAMFNCFGHVFTICYGKIHHFSCSTKTMERTTKLLMGKLTNYFYGEFSIANC